MKATKRIRMFLLSIYHKHLDWSWHNRGWIKIERKRIARLSFFLWSGKAGRHSLRQTNFAEAESILELDAYKLFGRAARIKNRKGVKDG